MATARSTKQARVPSYRSRAGYSHALVTLTDSATGKRRDYWLGPHGSPESREAYHRVLAEWEANGRRFPDERLLDVGHRAAPPPPARRAASGSADGHDGAIRTPDLITPAGGVARSSGLTVNDVIHNYWLFAKGYYGASSLYSIKVALRVVRELYGSSPAAAFGPNALRIVRESMIHGKPEGYRPREPWARKTVNTRVGNIQRMFRWAASRELIDAGIYHALQTLPPLKRGRSKAVDHEPVKPVPREMVDAIKPYVSKQVAALIDLQVLTGARPGELLRLRACDIDTSSRSGVWTYRPKEHKNAYREKDRALYFGPRAQEVLSGFMSERSLDAYLFSPSDAEDERRAKLTASRRTYLSCGNTVGSVVIDDPAHLPGDHYTTASYRRAIERACDLAFPAPAPLCRRELASGRFEGEGALLARLSPEQRSQLEAWRRAHRWHPHQLRHLAATEIRAEFGLEASALVLGHGSATLTDRVYAERDENKVLEVVRRIG